MSKRDKDRTLREGVRRAGLSSPPADAAGIPTVPPAEFEQWLADRNRQLPSDAGERLARALGLELPEIDVEDFRRSGYLPEVLVNFLALNGWSPGDDLEKFDAEFLCRRFDLDRVVRTPARFDRAKLLAFNLDAIQQMGDEAFLARLREHGERHHPAFLAAIGEEGLARLARASKPRSKTLDEPFRLNAFLVAADDAIRWERSKAIDKALWKGSPSGAELLGRLLPSLEAAAAWDEASLEALTEAFAAEHAGGSLGSVAQPLRVAVSGGTVSPPIFDTLLLLGRDRTLRRLRRCLDWCREAAPC